MTCQSIGLPPISTIGLGRTAVSSLRREPKPPARITTFTHGHVSRPAGRSGPPVTPARDDRIHDTCCLVYADDRGATQHHPRRQAGGEALAAPPPHAPAARDPRPPTGGGGPAGPRAPRPRRRRRAGRTPA